MDDEANPRINRAYGIDRLSLTLSMAGVSTLPMLSERPSKMNCQCTGPHEFPCEYASSGDLGPTFRPLSTLDLPLPTAREYPILHCAGCENEHCMGGVNLPQEPSRRFTTDEREALKYACGDDPQDEIAEAHEKTLRAMLAESLWDQPRRLTDEEREALSEVLWAEKRHVRGCICVYCAKLYALAEASRSSVNP